MTNKTKNNKINFTTEEFKEIMATMCDGFDKEYLESPMFKHFMENSKYLDDPSSIHCMIQYPFEKAIQLAIQYKFKKSSKVARIYLDFDFLENNVSRLCEELYGSACSVDKGSFLVRSYIKFKETGEIPKLDWEQEYTYHYPESGTMEQWMDFIQAVYNLKYGIYKGHVDMILQLHMAKKHPEYLEKLKKYKEEQEKKDAVSQSTKQEKKQ